MSYPEIIVRGSFGKPPDTVSYEFPVTFELMELDDQLLAALKRDNPTYADSCAPGGPMLLIIRTEVEPVIHVVAWINRNLLPKGHAPDASRDSEFSARVRSGIKRTCHHLRQEHEKGVDISNYMRCRND